MDQLVQFGRDQLENNRERIRTRIAQRSPWWLPRFVDEQIYDQLVAELARILDEIGDDPAHPARSEFNERLASIRDALTHDPVLVQTRPGAEGRVFQSSGRQRLRRRVVAQDQRLPARIAAGSGVAGPVGTAR